MKILYILQQSILNNRKKWVSADSNINMLAGLLNAWADYEEFGEVEIDIVIAPVGDFADIKRYSELFDYPNVNFIPYRFFPNAMMNRFNVDAGLLTDILRNGDYNVVINCITEMSHALRVLIDGNGLDTKLVTQCFWLDAPFDDNPKFDEKLAIYMAQITGMFVSDLCVFTCKSTLESFDANCQSVVQPWILNEIHAKSTIWDFGYSDNEVVDYLNKPKVGKNVCRIGFLNRITNPDYTNYSIFRDAIKNLADDPDYRDRFEVVCTNPSKRYSEEELRQELYNYVSVKDGDPLNRREYFEFLQDCQVTVHLFQKELYGGCALRESIACGNMIVTIDENEQGTLVFDKNTKVSPDKVTPAEVANCLRYAIDVVTLALSQHIIYKAMERVFESRNENYLRCSFEKTVLRVMEDLETLTGKEL